MRISDWSSDVCSSDLLTRDDQAAALRVIATHLNPRGRFVFDSRNPAAEAWRNWMPERSQRRLTHPTLGAVEAWNDASPDATTSIEIGRTAGRERGGQYG